MLAKLKENETILLGNLDASRKIKGHFCISAYLFINMLQNETLYIETIVASDDLIIKREIKKTK